jgi:hypothetical protein
MDGEGNRVHICDQSSFIITKNLYASVPELEKTSCYTFIISGIASILCDTLKAS